MSDEFRLNAYDRLGQAGVDIAALAGGGFVAVWTDEGQDAPGVGGSSGVYARRFDADGDPRGNEFRVHSGIAGDQGVASVAALEDGGFAVSWSSKGPNVSGEEDPYYEAYLRIFEAGGRPRTPDIQITPSTRDDHFVADLEALPDGGFVAVTQSSNVSTNWELAGLRVSAEGRQIGARAILDPSAYTGTASLAANTSPGVGIAAQSDGDYVMAWWEQDRGVRDSQVYVVDRVYARVFDRSGDPIGRKRAVTDFSLSRDKNFPHVAALDDGRFGVAWTGDGDDNDVYFRILGRDGAPETRERLVNGGDRRDDQAVSDVTHLGEGLALVTYASVNEAASPFPNDFSDIRGRLFDADGAPVGRAFTLSEAPRNEQGRGQVVVLASGELMAAWQRGGTLNEDLYGRIIDLGASRAGGRGDDVLRGTLLKETIAGGGGDDRILAGGGDDKASGGGGRDGIRGDDGDDRLYGGSGDDQLAGGNGDDRLYGGPGDDRLNGGRGDDLLEGGDGADVFVFARRGDRDRITDFDAGADRIDLRSLDLSARELREALVQRGDDARLGFGGGDLLVIEDVRIAGLDDAFLL